MISSNYSSVVNTLHIAFLPYQVYPTTFQKPVSSTLIVDFNLALTSLPLAPLQQILQTILCHHKIQTLFYSAMMELTWSHEYCLACDKQISSGAYCSQSCRQADLEFSSPQTTPSTSHFPHVTGSKSPFELSPAIDWASYKTPHSGRPGPLQSSNDDKSLSSSTSRSSLSSNTSTKSQHPVLTDKINAQLRDYTNAFDTTRNRGRGWSS